METRIIKIGESQIDFFREEDQTFLAVKPACEILKINPATQTRQINSDSILGSVAALRASTGEDGKEYDMLHLPLQEFIWWLLNIDANKVKADNRETLRNSQWLIFQTVYTTLNSRVKLYQAKDKAISQQIDMVDMLSVEYDEAKRKFSEAKKELEKLKETPVDEFGQQSLFTENQQKGIAA